MSVDVVIIASNASPKERTASLASRGSRALRDARTFGDCSRCLRSLLKHLRVGRIFRRRGSSLRSLWTTLSSADYFLESPSDNAGSCDEILEGGSVERKLLLCELRVEEFWLIVFALLMDSLEDRLGFGR